MKPLFIAEIKTCSPFGFKSPHSVGFLTKLACQHGDIVAAHTEEAWGGSFNHLAAVANLAHACNKIVIAKGIHANDEDIHKALAHGADLVLVVDRRPPRNLAPVCIWEPTALNDITYASDHTQKIMWNARNLNTGQPKTEGFDTARWLHKGWMIQASFITTPDDVHAKADAFIVGENLPTFVEAYDG